jgi:AraC-like DNA-binding protein
VWRVQPRCFVAGQITGPLLLRPAGAARILGVHFHPHGLAVLTGIPASEFTDRMVRLDDISRDLAGIGDVNAGDISAVADLEARLLGLARAPVDLMVGEAVCELAGSNGTRDIASLARDFGMSTRHLERRFLERVGLRPKVFSRMRRFQSVFGAIENGDSNWAAAAIACGYYDQAHLIRDFREFAGEPPTSLVASDDLARHFLSHGR